MSGGCTSATENGQAPHATRNVRANATARQEGDFQHAAGKIGGGLKNSRAPSARSFSPYEAAPAGRAWVGLTLPRRDHLERCRAHQGRALGQGRAHGLQRVCISVQEHRY